MSSSVCGDQRRLLLCFFFIALVLYAPGMWWGLPHATAANRIRPWNPDELAPLGPVAELYSVLHHSPRFNPQYPLFHYAVQALFVGPYVALLWLSGELTEFSTEYPYGLSDPQKALAMMTLLARSVSLLMASAVVAIACRTAGILWNQRAAVIAALFVLLTYPMFYYSRISTVDMGALFWTSLGSAVFAACIRDGLTRSRALWLGIFAALATATKDSSYAPFALMGLFVGVQQVRRRRQMGLRQPSMNLLLGFLTALVVYLFASGFVFYPHRYLMHIAFLTGLADRAAGFAPDDLPAYQNFLYLTVIEVVHCVGLPMAILACVGLLLCGARAPKTLAFTLPAVGILVGVIVPVRFVLPRFVIVIGYVFALFAACAVSMGLRHDRQLVRAAAGLSLLIACGWALVRGVDLSFQMLNDSRYELAAWLKEKARPGDRIGFYAEWDKFPALDSSIVTVPMPGQKVYLAGQPPDSYLEPEFIMVFAFDARRRQRDWTLPHATYERLLDGSLNYELVLTVHTPSLLSERVFLKVNPEVRLFARKDRLR